MITKVFDKEGKPIITPDLLYKEKYKSVCDVAILTFSRVIYSNVLEMYDNEVVGTMVSANRVTNIHLVTAEGVQFIFYLSEIGSALASTGVIEVNYKTGADKFIMFGSAGALDADRTSGKYVIPTSAYRGEGMSYYYAEPASYVTVSNADFVESVFREHGFPYTRGKVWTTDAIYRETEKMVNDRREEGCIAVEMELAGVQAVCDFHGFELYDFLVTGDVVDPNNYSKSGLHGANHSFEKFNAALAIAKSITKN